MITLEVIEERLNNLTKLVEGFCQDMKEWKEKHEEEHNKLWYKVGLVSAVSMAVGFIIKMVIK